MQIEERFIMSKTGVPEDCEDAVATGDSYIALLDGVTSKTSQRINGLTGGRFAAKALCRALQTADYTLPPLALLGYLSGSLKEALRGYRITEPAGAVIILYNAVRSEIICYGDCQLILNGSIKDNGKEIDTLLSGKRAEHLRMRIKAGATVEDLMRNDTGRELIQNELLAQNSYANRDVPLGFGVINGDLPLERFVRVYQVKGGDRVVFASDGYPYPAQTLAESEERLSLLLRTDPLCIGDYRSTHGMRENCISYDDRSYISFTV